MQFGIRRLELPIVVGDMGETGVSGGMAPLSPWCWICLPLLGSRGVVGRQSAEKGSRRRGDCGPGLPSRSLPRWRGYCGGTSLPGSRFSSQGEDFPVDTAKGDHERASEFPFLGLPWRSVVKTLRFHCRRHRFDPWSGN